MKVRFTLSIGYPGAKHVDEMEFPDDTTDDEIDEEYQGWCSNYLDGSWEKLDKETL